MRRIIFISLILNADIYFTHSVHADVIKKTLSTSLECKVISAYGYFHGYSRAPEPKSTTKLDFKTLLNKEGTIDFIVVNKPAHSNGVNDFIYIPYTKPFKISKKYFYGNGMPYSIKLLSGVPEDGVILEILFPNQQRTLVNIRVESRGVTDGIAFMKCNKNNGITSQPSGQ